MCPASAKVFSIPELLEQILLFCDTSTDKPICLDLFIFLRVNRNFRNSILGSVALRRRMCLDYSPGIHRPSHCWYLTLAARKVTLCNTPSLSISPFGAMSMDRCLEPETEEWAQRLSMILDLDTLMRNGHDKFDLCMSRPLRLHKAPGDSWRQIKLFPSNSLVIVKLTVVSIHCEFALAMSALPAEKMLRFEPSEDTLGHLVTVLEREMCEYERTIKEIERASRAGIEPRTARSMTAEEMLGMAWVATTFVLSVLFAIFGVALTTL